MLPADLPVRTDSDREIYLDQPALDGHEPGHLPERRRASGAGAKRAEEDCKSEKGQTVKDATTGRCACWRRGAERDRSRDPM